MSLMPVLSAPEQEEIRKAAVSVLRGQDLSEIMLTCEHASCRVPEPWADLGLPRAELEDHIGWDRGAAALTRSLSDALSATAFLSGYSRLFAECNRMADADDFAAPVSGGVRVPGNQDLTGDELALRKALAFDPYHDAVGQYLDNCLSYGVKPLVISIHSFTPRLGDDERPWHIGVLWKGDGCFAEHLFSQLEAGYDGAVGLNEPYDARKYETMVLDHHVLPRRLPHAILEIRNDLLEGPEQVAEWSRLISRCVKAIEPVSS